MTLTLTCRRVAAVQWRQRDVTRYQDNVQRHGQCEQHSQVAGVTGGASLRCSWQFFVYIRAVRGWHGRGHTTPVRRRRQRVYVTWTQLLCSPSHTQVDLARRQTWINHRPSTSALQAQYFYIAARWPRYARLYTQTMYVVGNLTACISHSQRPSDGRGRSEGGILLYVSISPGKFYEAETSVFWGKKLNNTRVKSWKYSYDVEFQVWNAVRPFEI